MTESYKALKPLPAECVGKSFLQNGGLSLRDSRITSLCTVSAFALGYDLDRHGVAVIDAQNNGSPAMFAVLARALNIPWLAVFDGDQAGQTYKRQIAERGFNADEINYRIHLHSENDLETQLVADGLNTELRAILETLGERNADSLNDKDLIERLQNSKTRYAPALAEQLRSNVDLAQRSPEAFRNAIGKLRGLE